MGISVSRGEMSVLAAPFTAPLEHRIPMDPHGWEFSEIQSKYKISMSCLQLTKLGAETEMEGALSAREVTLSLWIRTFFEPREKAMASWETQITKEPYHILSYLWSSQWFTLKEGKGKIGPPFVPYPPSTSLLLGNSEAENVDRMHAHQEVK